MLSVYFIFHSEYISRSENMYSSTSTDWFLVFKRTLVCKERATFYTYYRLFYTCFFRLHVSLALRDNNLHHQLNKKFQRVQVVDGSCGIMLEGLYVSAVHRANEVMVKSRIRTLWNWSTS